MKTVWTVILAGGSGTRLAAVTCGTPKQYWRPEGGHSLLEETLARVAPLTEPSRTTVVVDRSHRRYVESTPRSCAADWILYQPSDRGTAVGVLMGLGPMLESTDDGVVLLTPADHGVSNPGAFRTGIRDAIVMIESGFSDVVLFGVEPSEPVSDYGWILPGVASVWPTELPLRPVRGFTEKPSSAVASALFRAGALWNTMVLVAKASALMGLYTRHLSNWTEAFARYRTLPVSRREESLERQYALLPSADFSRDILTPAQGLSVFSWPSALGWTDLGTPERLARWLDARLVTARAVPA